MDYDGLSLQNFEGWISKSRKDQKLLKSIAVLENFKLKGRVNSEVLQIILVVNVFAKSNNL